jgi:thioredoxin-related protein
MAIITIKKFSKNGCRPCQALANFIGDIDLFNAGATLENYNISDEKIRIGEEELTSEQVVDKYKLQSVPTLIFERSGVEVHRLVGLRPVEEIIDAIEYAKVVR